MPRLLAAGHNKPTYAHITVWTTILLLGKFLEARPRSQGWLTRDLFAVAITLLPGSFLHDNRVSVSKDGNLK